MYTVHGTGRQQAQERKRNAAEFLLTIRTNYSFNNYDTTNFYFSYYFDSFG